MKGIKIADIANKIIESFEMEKKMREIKKTKIENSKPTMPIIDILGFRKTNMIIKKNISLEEKISFFVKFLTL